MTTAILVYVLVQLAIGAWVARRITSEQDYLLAGRRLGPFVASVSVFATWFGAESCVGAAGQVYSEGLGPLSVEPFAYGIALIAVGLLIAAPLWRSGVMTYPEYLRDRYSHRVERIMAVLHIPGTVLWAAAQIRAFGQVLSSTGDVDISVAITIAAAISVLYTVRGGLLADVVTDVIQGAVLVIGLVCIAGALLFTAGGLDTVVAAVSSRPEPAAPVEVGTLELIEAWLIPLGGSLVSQEVLARTLAARSPNSARVAAIGGGTMYLLVGLIPVLIGMVGISLMPGLEDPEQIVPTMARELLHPALYVVFAGALVSAILSTVDSALLVAGSLLSRNVLDNEGLDDAARLRRARMGVLVFGIAAWAISLTAEGVADLVEQASGFGSAGMLVVLMMGLFTKQGSARCALAALGTGFVAWIIGRYILDDVAFPYLVALASSAAAYLLAWLLERHH